MNQRGVIYGKVDVALAARTLTYGYGSWSSGFAEASRDYPERPGKHLGPIQGRSKRQQQAGSAEQQHKRNRFNLAIDRYPRQARLAGIAPRDSLHFLPDPLQNAAIK
ncbi:hypothetical protein ABIF90_004788 [Bradyrhizobium japonicum]